MQRRHFLLFLLGLPAVSCSGGESAPTLSFAERKRAFDTSLDCSSAAGLWPAESKTRTDNEYIDRTATEDQACFNCSNYVKAEEPGTCATCRTVKGPIHPLGWCNTWTELQR